MGFHVLLVCLLHEISYVNIIEFDNLSSFRWLLLPNHQILYLWSSMPQRFVIWTVIQELQLLMDLGISLLMKFPIDYWKLRHGRSIWLEKMCSGLIKHSLTVKYIKICACLFPPIRVPASDGASRGVNNPPPQKRKKKPKKGVKSNDKKVHSSISVFLTSFSLFPCPFLVGHDLSGKCSRVRDIGKYWRGNWKLLDCVSTRDLLK